MLYSIIFAVLTRTILHNLRDFGFKLGFVYIKLAIPTCKLFNIQYQTLQVLSLWMVDVDRMICRLMQLV